MVRNSLRGPSGANNYFANCAATSGSTCVPSACTAVSAVGSSPSDCTIVGAICLVATNVNSPGSGIQSSLSGWRATRRYVPILAIALYIKSARNGVYWVH